VDLDLRERSDGRNGERVEGPVFDSFAEERDFFEHAGLRTGFDLSSILGLSSQADAHCAMHIVATIKPSRR
jgi:hypothetical protein